LCRRKRDTVLLLVILIFFGIPFEMRFRHVNNLSRKRGILPYFNMALFMAYLIVGFRGRTGLSIRIGEAKRSESLNTHIAGKMRL
jgi:hypothetical protein